MRGKIVEVGDALLHAVPLVVLHRHLFCDSDFKVLTF